MSYIKFEKSQVVNLEYSLVKGGYKDKQGRFIFLNNYCWTAIPENIMDYLYVLLISLDGERYVLLSSLDVTVVK